MTAASSGSIPSPATWSCSLSGPAVSPPTISGSASEWGGRGELSSGHRTLSSVVAGHEVSGLRCRSVAELPPHYQRVIILYKLEGSPDEVSQKMRPSATPPVVRPAMERLAADPSSDHSSVTAMIFDGILGRITLSRGPGGDPARSQPVSELTPPEHRTSARRSDDPGISWNRNWSPVRAPRAAGGAD